MEENRNKEKYPYCDFVIGNKWIYRGAQEAPSISPREQPYPNHGDGHVWERWVGRDLRRPPGPGWRQTQPSGPPSPALPRDLLPQPGLTEQGEASPASGLNSTRRTREDSALHFFPPWHLDSELPRCLSRDSAHNSSLCIFLMQSCLGSAAAISPKEWEEIHC